MNSLSNPVNDAFSSQSSLFDQLDKTNPVLIWMRKITRQHVMGYLKKGMHLLELNAGTGLDALYFAQQGIRVHATDLSHGMIEELKKKASSPEANRLISVQQCSFTELEQVYQKEFDHIFSNFGGLNCISDLREVTRNFDHLLKPGAYATFVIMPPVCPWEILGGLSKGKFRDAFRRFHRKGTTAHIEGVYFQCFYFSVRDIRKAFGKNYRMVSLKGLGSLSPPPSFGDWALKHKSLYRVLSSADEKLMSYYPCNHWADHVIITMQRLG